MFVYRLQNRIRTASAMGTILHNFNAFGKRVGRNGEHVDDLILTWRSSPPSIPDDFDVKQVPQDGHQYLTYLRIIRRIFYNEQRRFSFAWGHGDKIKYFILKSLLAANGEALKTMDLLLKVHVDFEAQTQQVHSRPHEATIPRHLLELSSKAMPLLKEVNDLRIVS